MCTECFKCQAIYAANQEACPKCGEPNPRPIRPRAKAATFDPEADRAKADKALAIFSIIVFAAWVWLEAAFTILERTGAM